MLSPLYWNFHASLFCSVIICPLQQIYLCAILKHFKAVFVPDSLHVCLNNQRSLKETSLQWFVTNLVNGRWVKLCFRHYFEITCQLSFAIAQSRQQLVSCVPIVSDGQVGLQSCTWQQWKTQIFMCLGISHLEKMCHEDALWKEGETVEAAWGFGLCFWGLELVPWPPNLPDLKHLPGVLRKEGPTGL